MTSTSIRNPRRPTPQTWPKSRQQQGAFREAQVRQKNTEMGTTFVHHHHSHSTYPKTFNSNQTSALLYFEAFRKNSSRDCRPVSRVIRLASALCTPKASSICHVSHELAHSTFDSGNVIQQQCLQNADIDQSQIFGRRRPRTLNPQSRPSNVPKRPETTSQLRGYRFMPVGHVRTQLS